MNQDKTDIKPEISVVMLSYNYGCYIGEAIESVLEQTFTSWELIIVDDGSTDDSLDIIGKYTGLFPGKIFLFTHEGNVNKGIRQSLELAFMKLRGKYTAFLESDDRWLPLYLEKKHAVMEKEAELSVVWSDLNLIGKREAITAKYIDYVKYSRYIGKLSGNKPFDPLKPLLLRNPVVSFSNIFIKSEILRTIRLDGRHQVWSDWLVLLQAAMRGKFLYISEKLLDWRIHRSSANSAFMNKIDPYFEGSRFKIDLLKIIADYTAETGDEVLFRKTLEGSLSYKAHLYRFFHDLGFALYSPVSVIRTFIRGLK